MATKTRAGLIGAIVVVALLLIHSVEHWTIVDAVISGLRGRGVAGVWLADFLISPIVPLVIAIAAIYLVFEGRKEKSHDTPTPSISLSPIHVEAKDVGNSTATGGTGGNASVGDIIVNMASSLTPAQTPVRKPNVVYEGIRIVDVDFEDSDIGEFIIREIDKPTGTKAVVVCVRNRPRL